MLIFSTSTNTKKNIEDYFQNIKLVASRLIAKWRNDKTVTCTMSDLSKYALDILALSLFGMDFDSISNPVMLAKNIDDLFKVLFKRSLSPFRYWKIPFCSNIDGGRDLSESILNVLRTLVRDYKRQKQDGGKMVKKDGRSTCLQKLVDISDDDDDARLDEERVVGNLATLMVAGTDTTSNTLSVCLWEIANDSDLQDGMYQEVIASGCDIDNLTLDDTMTGFPILHSLVFEVLRVKGPAPVVFLEPAEPVELQGQVLKPGTSICALTRTFGEKAGSEIPVGPNGESLEQFYPSRWLIQQGTSEKAELKVKQPTNKYGGYMPFGHGRRIW